MWLVVLAFAMEPFVLERRTVVLGGGVANCRQPVVLDTKFVDGVEYFRAKASDSCLARLLSGKSSRSKRPLTGCKIFSDIATLRDAAIELIVNPPAAEDLGLDDEDTRTRKRVKHVKNRLDVPAAVSVQLPGVDDVGGSLCKVLTEDQLYIELTPATLTYIASRVRACTDKSDNASENDVENQAPKQTDDQVHKHISFDPARQAFKVR